VVVSLIAIAVTFALLAYQRRIIAQTGSVAIRTDSIHYQSDLLLNLAVAAALLLDQVAGLTGADPVFGSPSPCGWPGARSRRRARRSTS
jgi:ferrous-iron efflux pump FieF